MPIPNNLYNLYIKRQNYTGNQGNQIQNIAPNLWKRTEEVNLNTDRLISAINESDEKIKNLENDINKDSNISKEQLKEITQLLTPDEDFDFNEIKYEIIRLKIRDLKFKFQEFINNFDDDIKEILETFLEAQNELQNNENNVFVKKQLSNAKKNLEKKLNSEQMDFIYNNQNEILKLEEIMN